MAQSESVIAQPNSDNGKPAPAAYLPFRTFTSSIESLEHGVPKQIDRTIWRSQSGVVQGQIMMAFRFLGFIDANDCPTQLLHDYVEQKEARKLTMLRVLHTAYASVLEQDLTKMSTKMLDDAFDVYGVTGDTKRKAVTFFLKAAKFADVPMHPLLSAQVRNTGPRGKRRAERRISDDGANTIKVVPDAITSGVQAANTRTIRLRSGGTVTMSVSYDPFSLSTEDRQFVFELIDTLQKYSSPDLSDEESDEEEDDA